MDGIIVAFPNKENAANIRNLLVRGGMEVRGVCTTGAQTLNCMEMLDEGIVVCGYKLADMMYTELREYMPKEFEMLLIAAVAFVISLGTGKLVSNVVGNMLESGTNNNQVQMQMPEIRDQNNDSNNTNSTSGNDKMFDQAFNGPENTELDVSLTTTTVMQLAGITIAICLVSIAIPSAYVLRLSPREILVKKEG